MTVQELIKKLELKDQKATVLLYIYEDFAPLEAIKSNIEYNNKDYPYCKGWSFAEYEKEEKDTNFVILGDYL